MNKTDRKNKTKLVVNWPPHGSLFIIDELHNMNPEFVKITLRVRLDKAIKKDKTVALIGYKNLKKGRPVMVLSMNPVEQSLLDEAYTTGGIQAPETNTIIPVISVTTSELVAEKVIYSDTKINDPATISV